MAPLSNCKQNVNRMHASLWNYIKRKNPTPLPFRHEKLQGFRRKTGAQNYSLQSAVCSLRSAVCGLRSVVCGLRSAVCGLRSANFRRTKLLQKGPLQVFNRYRCVFNNAFSDYSRPKPRKRHAIRLTLTQTKQKIKTNLLSFFSFLRNGQLLTGSLNLKTTSLCLDFSFG